MAGALLVLLGEWLNSPLGLSAAAVAASAPLSGSPSTHTAVQTMACPPFPAPSSKGSSDPWPSQAGAAWIDPVSENREIHSDCLSGKGIYWKGIRKLTQQKGMLNNQTLSSWGPEPFPGAGNAQAACLGIAIREMQFCTFPILPCPPVQKSPGETLWLSLGLGQILPTAAHR